MKAQTDARGDAIAEHLAYHGPGLTFGELAIDECFTWAAPIPDGPEPLRKTSATTYGWSRGTGTAEEYYRVERVADVGRSAGGATGSSACSPHVEKLHRPADANAEES